MASSFDVTPAPPILSRAGGVLYLLIILIGVGEAIAREQIIAGGNAAVTAASLRSMEWLWRASTAGEFLLLICATAFDPRFLLVAAARQPLPGPCSWSV